MITLKDISPLDRYIYRKAQSIPQPFSPQELLDAIIEDHPLWDIKFIRYRCKLYYGNNMLQRTGHFRNKQYACLLTETDMENAKYVFSPPIDLSNNPFVCGL